MKRHSRPFVPVSLVPRAFGTIKVGAAKRRRESISPFPARKGSIKENLTRRLFQWRNAAFPRGIFQSPPAPFSAAGHAPARLKRKIAFAGPPRPALGAFRPSRPRFATLCAWSLRSLAHSTAKSPRIRLRSRRKFQPSASPSAFFGAHPPRKNAFQAFPPRPTAYP